MLLYRLEESVQKKSTSISISGRENHVFLNPSSQTDEQTDLCSFATINRLIEKIIIYEDYKIINRNYGELSTNSPTNYQNFQNFKVVYRPRLLKLDSLLT